MENLVNNAYLAANFKGKKIFITGHTGFKGTWLSLWLKELGAIVKGYALAPEFEHCIYNLMQPLAPEFSIIEDIRNKEQLKTAIASFQPEYIFHLAAQPLVRRSYQIPSETFEVNTIGTANLLEVLQLVNGKCTTVIITTDKVYENLEQDILYKEDDRLGGYDPYSASKACAEIVSESFRNSFFNLTNFATHQKAIVTARAGNVIGGGDFSKDRILPDIVAALKDQRDILVRNPNAVRPWQHVLEPLGGYLLLAATVDNSINFSGAFNFGPEPSDHLTVEDLVKKAIAVWGSGNWKDISDVNAPHEAGLLQLSIDKAKQQLNWHPKLNAAEAIEWTIEWYRKPEQEANHFTLEQIKKYMEL